MSKIYDALHKASGGEPEEDPRREISAESAPEPIDPEVVKQAPPAETTLGDTPFLDELNQLRANLDRILPAGTPQSLLITGAVPGEGASTVATSFAQVLSEDPSYRVMYVDADLRNQDERPVPPVEGGGGFAAVMEGRAGLSDTLRPSRVPRLDVLASEGLHQAPYRSTSAERLKRMLAEAKSEYHRVLIDAAPVLVAPETPVMASCVDGVILVVRSGKEKREVILEAVDSLKKRNARLLGVVMNRQKYVVPGFIYRRL